MNLSRDKLHGIWPALITPWTTDFQIDERRLDEEIQYFAEAGVHGTYTGGTTGEFYAQDDTTFIKLTKAACDSAQSANLPIQIGCTGLSTRISQNRIKIALDFGANAIQFALPFWLPLDDGETIQFIGDLVAAAGETPLILYQTTRSKRRIDPPLIGQICREFPTFIGMKDPGCSLELLPKIVADAPALAVFGTDVDLLERIRLGGTGTYSSVAGLNAKVMLAIYRHASRGDFHLAEPLQDAVRRLMREVLHPMSESEGLHDSALDRIQREVGGGRAGLLSQPPYRSASPNHVATVRAWCQRNAPVLLS